MTTLTAVTESSVPPKKPRHRKASGVTLPLPSAALVASVAAPDFVVLPLAHLLPSTLNPRTDADADLGGLTASMVTEREPYLLQPPLVEQHANGWRIVSGERRVRAAALAGWNSVACLLCPTLDPVLAHTMRIVENLHRADLHPLDAATALKIAWLSENCLALGATEAVTSVLMQELGPSATLDALTGVAAEAGFIPSHPAITWEALLGRLGLGIERERLKKLLRVLNLHVTVLQAVRSLQLSEAALRALGTLSEADQQELTEALVDDPALGSKIRRIARRAKQKGYPIAKAIAEVRGQVYMPYSPGKVPVGEPNSGDDSRVEAQERVPGGEHVHSLTQDTTPAESSSDLLLDVGPDCADAVLRLLELAEQIGQTITTIETTSNGVAPKALPSPWGDIVQEATALIQTTLNDHALH